MICVTKKSQCCGCGSCAQSCPKLCIKMTEDEEGFIYPVIDKSACINCGLCERVCPILAQKAKTKEDKELDCRRAYVAYHKDRKIRRKSSSGGVFSALASALMLDGGSVYGAAFDNDFMVHHIAVRDEDGLEALRGSKYLQSRTEQTFQEVRQELKEGKKILYTGTPCQISGLKKYLREEYDDLYTASILCHGVPSPKVWRIYLQDIQKNYGAKVKQVSFRDKLTGWKYYSMTMLFDNQSRFQSERRENKYMQLFLANVCLRPSCHTCVFKDKNNVADIILGDSWGIQNYMPEMDDDQGTSVVIVQNEKGDTMLKKAATFLQMREVELDTAWPKNADSRISVQEHPKRAKFFRLLNRGCSMKELHCVLKPSIMRRIVERSIRILHED